MLATATLTQGGYASGGALASTSGVSSQETSSHSRSEEMLEAMRPLHGLSACLAHPTRSVCVHTSYS